MVGVRGIEPPAVGLRVRCSTVGATHPGCFRNNPVPPPVEQGNDGGNDGARTRDLQRDRLAIYQLIYIPKFSVALHLASALTRLPQHTRTA